MIGIKGNQPNLHSEAMRKFRFEKTENAFEYWDKRGGRVTRYEISVREASSEAKAAWPGLRVFVAVRRSGTRGGKPVEPQVSHCASSLDWSAERLGRAVQAHWGIENSLHWVKDAVLGEDAQGVAHPGLATVLAFLKTLAVNLLRKNEPFASVKAGIRRVAHDLSQMKELCS